MTITTQNAFLLGDILYYTLPVVENKSFSFVTKGKIKTWVFQVTVSTGHDLHLLDWCCCITAFSLSLLSSCSWCSCLSCFFPQSAIFMHHPCHLKHLVVHPLYIYFKGKAQEECHDKQTYWSCFLYSSTVHSAISAEPWHETLSWNNFSKSSPNLARWLKWFFFYVQ